MGDLAVAGRAVLLGAGTLLVSAGLAAVALLGVLPHLPPALAGRAPLLLAALALGGRLHVDGPAVGRLDPLRDGGLLGPLARSGDGTGHLSLTLVPATLTALVAVVIALAVRRGDGSPLARTGAAAAGMAAVGALVAVVGRTTVADTAVRVPIGGTAVGAALLGGLAAATGIALRRRVAGVRFAACLAVALCAAGLLAVVVLAASGRTGVVGTLVAGAGAPTGTVALLGILVAPAVAWDGAALALGVPLDASARALSLHTGHSVSVLDAARAVPAFALLPALALALVVGSAAYALRTARRPGRPGLLLAPVGLALVGRLVGGVALARHASTARESLNVAPSMWASSLWGIVVGVLIVAAARTGDLRS